MDEKNRIAEALAHDLRNEYGLAFRYLIIAEEMKQRGKEEVSSILKELAADSVSHSLIVKKMLKSLNYPYSDSVTPFSTDFANLETVLRGSYLLEKKMHIEYKKLAEGMEDGHPFKPLLTSLSIWERRHMASVAKALDELGDVGKEPPVHIVAEQLIKGREEELHEAEAWPAEDMFKSLGVN
ncbi:MAG: ferritin family protein, partial [Candidatus Thermoplasmatota archaeon]|nr:ferritin family protein [Candidatus Thermoplasmatota archaeon]